MPVFDSLSQEMSKQMLPQDIFKGLELENYLGLSFSIGSMRGMSSTS